MPPHLHPHSIDLPEAKGLQKGQILSHPRTPQPPQDSPPSLTPALLEDNACRGGTFSWWAPQQRKGIPKHGIWVCSLS